MPNPKKRLFDSVKKNERFFNFGSLLVLPFVEKRLVFASPVHGTLDNCQIYAWGDGPVSAVKLTVSIFKDAAHNKESTTKTWDIVPGKAFSISGELELLKSEAISFVLEAEGPIHGAFSCLFHALEEKAVSREIL